MRSFDLPIAAAACLCWVAGAAAGDWGGVLQGLAQKARDTVQAPRPPSPPEEKTSTQPRTPPDAQSAPDGSTTAGNSASAIKTYQNYDFVPGNDIVFDDDFRSDQDGEFPAHWKLVAGQGVVNTMAGKPTFALTEGNYVRVDPRVKSASYLTDSFTVEFDFYREEGGPDPGVCLKADGGEDEEQVFFGTEVSTAYFKGINDLHANYPGDHDAFNGKWHHAALVFKNGQMKAYLDQYRVLVVPDAGSLKPARVEICGIGSQEKPLVFTGVRIANGGAMNLIQALNKDGRVVTHGIHFDVNKATIEPDSMGTIRQILAALHADSSLKLEIDGHTDADGDAGRNQKLSEDRAQAVKALLVEEGVDGSRLTTKGYGASKPIASNDTLEGKAQNRRVELVKS